MVRRSSVLIRLHSDDWKSLTVGLSQIYMLPGTYANKQIERETLIKIRLRCHMTATILGALECWNSSCDVGSNVFLFIL